MKKIQKIASGANVTPILWALQAGEHLWNKHTARTESPASPHHEVDDIWVRYAAPEEHGKEGPHESLWYESPLVPLVKALVYPLMQFVDGDRLGGILITRIKAGKACKPHHDNGWHAQYYKKFAIQIQSAPGQFFSFDNEALEPMPGDIYMFRNEFTHWVENKTGQDRITLIACIKTDKEWT